MNSSWVMGVEIECDCCPVSTNMNVSATTAKATEVLHPVSPGLRMRGLDPGSETEEETGCSGDVVFEKDAESTVDGKIDQ